MYLVILCSAAEEGLLRWVALCGNFNRSELHTSCYVATSLTNLITMPERRAAKQKRKST